MTQKESCAKTRTLIHNKPKLFPVTRATSGSVFFYLHCGFFGWSLRSDVCMTFFSHNNAVKPFLPFDQRTP